ncbi:chaplin [Streptomyces purpureus]|uniref:Membrane protein n=1 Tax=Streptomyces purpureus TaxID=1951 RepID=A0A918LU75_9ACTN|nr:chaplin [Streptomyces purpureus]GGT52906.1 membrane protein [Streptomyces purpureus]
MLCKKAAVAVAGIVMALGGAAPAVADAGAKGAAVDSSGLLSGNVIQVPIHAQINACGNSINIIGLLNPAYGNVCINSD